jgi:hypothetical protein
MKGKRNGPMKRPTRRDIERAHRDLRELYGTPKREPKPAPAPKREERR